MFRFTTFPGTESIRIAKSMIGKAASKKDDIFDKYKTLPDYSSLTHDERKKESEKMKIAYTKKLSELVESLEDKDITLPEFESEVNDLTERYILLAFLVGSGLTMNQIRRTSKNIIDEQIELALKSSRKFGQRIENGEYTSVEDAPPKKNIIAAILLWGSVLGSMFNYGVVAHKDGQKMLRWDLGETEHCISCLKLAGQVHPAWRWRQKALYPKSRRLECGGWNCGCSFTEMPDGTVETGDFLDFEYNELEGVED